MESQSDQVVFENSINTDKDIPLFQTKQWTYITDSTSNSGSFSSGQISFDLSTFSSQNQWVDLKQCVLEIPYKITGKLTTAAVGTPSSEPLEMNTQFGYLASTFKNGAHQIIDSVQLQVNGQTLESQQAYSNVATSFKIYSTWSQDTLKKWGSVCGIAMDDMTHNLTPRITAIDDTSENYGAADGLYNAPTSQLLHTIKGYDPCSENASNACFNTGLSERFKVYNKSKTSTALANYILGNQMETSGMSNVGVAGAGANSTDNTVGDKFSLFAVMTVRLIDLINLEEFPLCKNLKGFLYINFNSFKTTITGDVGASALRGVIKSVNYQVLNGHTCPFIVHDSGNGVAEAGLTIGAGASTAPVVEFTGTVDATTTGAVGGASPIITNARLSLPFYVSNPKIDQALSTNKQFSILNKIINPIRCPKNQHITYTVSVGVPNPRRLVLIPFYENLALKTNPITNLTDPEHSCWDTVPATTSPFIYLKGLQVYLSNRALFNYPLDYNFESYIANQTELGLNGGVDAELTSGLISSQMWEQNHKFYSIDLSRRMSSMDGTSQSVQVSFTNGSADYNLKVLAILYFESNYTINTAQCLITKS